MLPKEVTVWIYGGSGMSGRRPGKRKFSCLFSIGHIEFKTSDIISEEKVLWNEQNTIKIKSTKHPLKIALLDDKKKFGKISIPIDEIPKSEPLEFVKSPVKPSKKYPQAVGFVEYKSWVSKFESETLSIGSSRSLFGSRFSLNTPLSSVRRNKSINIKAETFTSLDTNEQIFQPCVTLIHPKEGCSGDTIEVRGRHFGIINEDVESIVIGDQICDKFTLNSSSLFHVTIPENLAPGKVEVIVTTKNGGCGICSAILTILDKPEIAPQEGSLNLSQSLLLDSETKIDSLDKMMASEKLQNPFLEMLEEKEIVFPTQDISEIVSDNLETTEEKSKETEKLESLQENEKLFSENLDTMEESSNIDLGNPFAKPSQKVFTENEESVQENSQNLLENFETTLDSFQNFSANPFAVEDTEILSKSVEPIENKPEIFSENFFTEEAKVMQEDAQSENICEEINKVEKEASDDDVDYNEIENFEMSNEFGYSPQPNSFGMYGYTQNKLTTVREIEERRHSGEILSRRERLEVNWEKSRPEVEKKISGLEKGLEKNPFLYKKEKDVSDTKSTTSNNSNLQKTGIMDEGYLIKPQTSQFITEEKKEKSQLHVVTDDMEKSKVDLATEDIRESQLHVATEDTGKSKVDVPTEDMGKSQLHVATEDMEKSQIHVVTEVMGKSKVDVVKEEKKENFQVEDNPIVDEEKVNAVKEEKKEEIKVDDVTEEKRENFQVDSKEKFEGNLVKEEQKEKLKVDDGTEEKVEKTKEEKFPVDSFTNESIGKSKLDILPDEKKKKFNLFKKERKRNFKDGHSKEEKIEKSPVTSLTEEKSENSQLDTFKEEKKEQFYVFGGTKRRSRKSNVDAEEKIEKSQTDSLKEEKSVKSNFEAEEKIEKSQVESLKEERNKNLKVDAFTEFEKSTFDEQIQTVHQTDLTYEFSKYKKISEEKLAQSNEEIKRLKMEIMKLNDSFEDVREKYGDLLMKVMMECPHLLEK